MGDGVSHCESCSPASRPQSSMGSVIKLCPDPPQPDLTGDIQTRIISPNGTVT